MTRARRLGALALLPASSPARAHGSVEGLGDFWSGVVHPLLEPAHLMALVVLGLVIGQRGLHHGVPGVSWLALGAALGVAAAGLGLRVPTQVPLLAVAVLAGIAVALARPLPQAVIAGAAGVLSLGIGLDSAPELALSAGAKAVVLFGTWLGICLWTLNVVALVSEIRKPWLRLLVRVAGSWISAGALMVLALWAAGPQPPAAGQPGQPPGAMPPLDTGR